MEEYFTEGIRRQCRRQTKLKIREKTYFFQQSLLSFSPTAQEFPDLEKSLREEQKVSFFFHFRSFFLFFSRPNYNSGLAWLFEKNKKLASPSLSLARSEFSPASY